MSAPFIAMTPEQITADLARTRELLDAATDWCDQCTMSPCECTPPAPAKRARRGSLVDPTTVAFERPEWIKRDWYPAKVATMISGRGGSGKSSLTLADIAAGSRGELRGRRNGQPLRSIIVSV